MPTLCLSLNNDIDAKILSTKHIDTDSDDKIKISHRDECKNADARQCICF